MDKFFQRLIKKYGELSRESAAREIHIKRVQNEPISDTKNAINAKNERLKCMEEELSKVNYAHTILSQILGVE